jgi:hypothetical protein
MLAFPLILALLILALVAQLLLVLPEAGRSLYREHRISARRPALRAVLVLTLIELVLVILWVFLVAERMQ